MFQATATVMSVRCSGGAAVEAAGRVVAAAEDRRRSGSGRGASAGDRRWCNGSRCRDRRRRSRRRRVRVDAAADEIAARRVDEAGARAELSGRLAVGIDGVAPDPPLIAGRRRRRSEAQTLHSGEHRGVAGGGAVSERVAGPCGSGPAEALGLAGGPRAAFGAATIPARKQRPRASCAISRLALQTERRTRGPSEGRRIGRRRRIAGGRITRFDRDDREVRGS